MEVLLAHENNQTIITSVHVLQETNIIVICARMQCHI